MDSASPPVYGSDFRDNSVLEGSELPAYTGRRSHPSPATARRRHALTEHVFELTSKGTLWATLKVQSGAKCASQLPTFIEGEDITGSVNLNLGNGETIHSIVVSVNGQIITTADPGGCYRFLDCVQTLWSKSVGDPKQPVSQDKFNGKLCGTYSWPFSFRLPAEVSIPRLKGSAPHTYRLPQTFLERLTRASVQYELAVRISRGKLRSRSQMQTTIVYIPCTKPGPPSLLRQLAYQESSPLLGPEADPGGWKSIPFQIRGTIFNTRSVEANCTLSLATPLCYSRGAVIPCILSFETLDSQAMDLLSSPRTIDVRLRRCVTYCGNAGVVSNKIGRGWSEAVEDMATAVWWLSREEHSTDMGQRRLDGEIHLWKGLKPTSAMAHFAVEYGVIVMPFEPAAFISADTDILLRERVEIATMYPPGPRPKTYPPPGYEASSRASLVFQTYSFV